MISDARRSVPLKRFRYGIATLLKIMVIVGLAAAWIIHHQRTSSLIGGLQGDMRAIEIKVEDQAFMIETLQLQLEIEKLSRASDLHTLEFAADAAEASLRRPVPLTWIREHFPDQAIDASMGSSEGRQ